MPECWWFAKYGYCSAGDECLYAHPKERKIECPDYNRGFCQLGTPISPLGLDLHSVLTILTYISKVQHVRENMSEEWLVSCTSPDFVQWARIAREDSEWRC